MWTVTGAWSLQIDGPRQCPPKVINRAHWQSHEAAYHDLWAVSEIGKHPRKLEVGWGHTMRTKEIILQGNYQEQGNYSPISLQSLGKLWNGSSLGSSQTGWSTWLGKSSTDSTRARILFDKPGFLLWQSNPLGWCGETVEIVFLDFSKGLVGSPSAWFKGICRVTSP